jgi:Holliday junction resolvase
MAATLQGWFDEGFIPIYETWNKQNPLADPSQCGKYRPDFIYEWDEGVLIFEFDEEMHKDRIKRCELVRQAEVSLGFGGKPITWVRFNPDAFKVADVTLRTTKKKRETILLETLKKHIDNADYDCFIQIVYICYDKPERIEGSSDLLQTFKFATIQDYEGWVEKVAPA